MKYLFYCLFAFALLGCNSAPQTTKVLTLPPGTIPKLPPANQAVPARTIQSQMPQPQTQVTQVMPGSTGTTTNVTPVAPVAPKVVINPKDTRPNPKHGEPGHRCDIPVGTPLNSQPGIPAAATVKNQVLKGINPPHGEPNHRCDIAVGAPLNSKPVVAAAPVAAAPVAAPVVAPGKIEEANGGVRNQP